MRVLIAAILAATALRCVIRRVTRSTSSRKSRASRRPQWKEEHGL
jgi:hypothetical protein